MDTVNHQQLLNCMHETGLIPVFNHTDTDVAKKVLDACYEGGVRVFEFTNRGENALAVFGELVTHAQQYGDLYLGIGTLFTKEDASHFLDEGAHFLVSPALIPEIAHFANQQDLLWVPGCGTVTEIYQALQLGAKLIKVFPGNVLGTGFIKSVKAVYPKVLIMPTGGVKPTEENLSDWYSAGVHCVGMGSQLFKKNVIDSGQFNDLTESVSNTLKTIKKLRP
ncbi:MAG: bifunctional 4-hydroxy-2-oxoglutarate aldolase/2-dehydro-3-deoxy-phosphogluconate aldolase [Bacteroidota bacterium]